MPVANLVGDSERASQLQVVIAKLLDHLLRANSFFVVVFQPLILRDIADRADRRAADLPRSLGDRIGYGEDLRRLLVEQQMIITEVAPADMPVKILRFHVKRKHIGKQSM
jgi:hypothetical protein